MQSSIRKWWIPYLVAVVLVAAFVRLGWWQLERGQEKAQLFRDFDANVDATPEALDPTGIAAVGRYAPVQISGTFDDRSILLDNQVLNGRTGVHVLTPLKLAGSEVAILVNRGWLPLDPARRALPDFETPTYAVELVGLISDPPRPGLQLGETQTASQWPQLVTYLDLPGLSQALSLNLSSSVALLSSESEHGFARAWRPKVMSPDRHRGYAVQWFALALTIVVVTGVLTYRLRT